MVFEPINGAMALSPDGKRIVFSARDSSARTTLWVRSLDALTAQPLAGTEDGHSPFWSPDSRFIGFFSNGKLRKIDANGGPPQVICDARNGRGGSWNRDGVIIFSPATTDPIHRVAAAGGSSTAVTVLDGKSGQASHRFPVFLPDGKHFLYLSDGKADTPGTEGGYAIWAAALDSKETKLVAATNSSVRYAPSGQLLFLRDRTLVAQPFDLKKLALTGEAVPVVENVVRTTRYEAIFSISNDGMLAYQEGEGAELSQLVWTDRDGRELGTAGKPADIRGFKLSNDGKRVATFITDPQSQKSDVWVFDLARGTSTRLTFDPADDAWPQWSVDDKTIYFTSARQGRGDIFRKASAGTGGDELVFKDADYKLISSMSRDGKLAAVQSVVAGKSGWDVSILSLADGKATSLLQTPFNEAFPSLSPDGRYLAYNSNESGRAEIFVLSLGGDGGKWQISTDGGYGPRWLRDGKELVFMTEDDKAMSVDIQFAPEFSASVPRLLFETKARAIIGLMWDATPDGTRFLINRPIDAKSVVPISLVQNWPAALGK
jgi:Tol biopolymer transport system component